MSNKPTPKFSDTLKARFSTELGPELAKLSPADYAKRTNELLEQMKLSRADGAARLVDLLGGEVAPGESAELGVRLPLGAEVTDIALGGTFELVKEISEQRPKALWYALQVKNVGEAPASPIAFLAVGVSQ